MGREETRKWVSMKRRSVRKLVQEIKTRTWTGTKPI